MSNPWRTPLWTRLVFGLGSLCVACPSSDESRGDDDTEKSSKSDSADEDDGDENNKKKKKGSKKKKKKGSKDDETSERVPKPIPKLSSWAKHFGSNHADGSNVGDGTVRPEDGQAVAVDAEGNVVVVGQFRGSADFGGGPLKVAGTIDIVVAKFDKSGAHQWSKRFGGKDDDEAVDLAIDAEGNIYVTGTFSGEIDFGGGAFKDKWGGFVLKLDKSGNHLWSQHVAGGLGFGVSVTPDGDVLASGHFWKKLGFVGEEVKGTGRVSAYLAKLDGSGNKKWLKTFSGTKNAIASGKHVRAHTDGSVYLLASLDKTVDFGGGPLTSAGGSDVAVVKLDANGGHVWSKRFGAKSSEYTHRLAVDSSGAVVVAGSFTRPFDFGGEKLTSNGSSDVFIAKLDAAGGHVWSKSYGGKKGDNAYDVAIDPKGNIAVTGSFNLSVDFDGESQQSAGEYDAYVLRLDASGQRVWSKRLGGSTADYGHGVAIDGNGAVVATGHFVGKATYTGGELTSNGGHDIYLVTFAD